MFSNSRLCKIGPVIFCLQHFSNGWKCFWSRTKLTLITKVVQSTETDVQVPHRRLKLTYKITILGWPSWLHFLSDEMIGSYHSKYGNRDHWTALMRSIVRLSNLHHHEVAKCDFLHVAKIIFTWNSIAIQTAIYRDLSSITLINTSESIRQITARFGQFRQRVARAETRRVIGGLLVTSFPIPNLTDPTRYST